MVTKAALRKRIEQACVKVDLCPRDGDPLLCGQCQLDWAGTPEQWAEFHALNDRLPPLGAHPGPTPYTCQTCGQPLWCKACFSREAATMTPRPISPPLTREEVMRFRELGALLMFKPRGQAVRTIQLQWSEAPPPEPTTPVVDRLRARLSEVGQARIDPSSAPPSPIPPASVSAEDIKGSGQFDVKIYAKP